MTAREIVKMFPLDMDGEKVTEKRLSIIRQSQGTLLVTNQSRVNKGRTEKIGFSKSRGWIVYTY